MLHQRPGPGDGTACHASGPRAPRAPGHRSGRARRPALSGGGGARSRRPLSPGGSGRHPYVRSMGARPACREPGRPDLAHLAPAPRSPLSLCVRSRARLQSARLRTLPSHRPSRPGPGERVRRERGGARRLQGLRGQPRPQGARLDGHPAPGLRLPEAGERPLPLAGDLALPPPRRAPARPHPPDGGFRSGRPQLPHLQAPRPHAPSTQPGLPLGLRGVGHRVRRGRRVQRPPGVRHRQRHHAVRRPAAGGR